MNPLSDGLSRSKRLIPYPQGYRSAEAPVSQTLPISELGTSRANVLDRIVEAGMVAQGRVFALSLEPIRQQLGERWPARADHVWETVERALAKRMPAPDVFLRINEVTVMAAIASTDAYEGQVRCAEVLRSILAFFLGRSAEEDLGISRVSALSGGTLSMEPVDLAVPPRPSVEPRTSAKSPVSPDRWVPPLAGRRLLSPFMSERQGLVRMHFDVVPVWRLDQGFIGAYALRRRLPCRIDGLSDFDREQMDHRVVDHLVPLLQEYRRHRGAFPLIIPGTYSSASTRRPRVDLVERCNDVLDLMRSVVVMEIDGLSPGAPAGRLSETAAMMKPFFHVVTACVADTAQAETVFRGFAFKGLAIDAGKVPDSRLDALICAARRRMSNVIVHDLKRQDEARIAALGVTHVSFLEDSVPLTGGTFPNDTKAAA